MSSLDYYIPYTETELTASMYGYGFTCQTDSQIGIATNSQLEESRLTYARAHELGHALLHDHAGYYLIAESVLVPPGRYEREADEPTQALLGDVFPDERLR